MPSAIERHGSRRAISAISTGFPLVIGGARDLSGAEFYEVLESKSLY